MESGKREKETHKSYDNGLKENRFKVLLFLFRIGGFPIQVNSVSGLNALYNASLIVCFYTTYICVSADTFVHRHQLELAMKPFRIVALFLIGIWLHFSVR
jgi:hypothetical protein